MTEKHGFYARTAATTAFFAVLLVSTAGSATDQGQGASNPQAGRQISMSVKSPVRHAKSTPIGRSTRPERPGPDREAPEVRVTGPSSKPGGGGGPTVDPAKQLIFPPATPPVALASVQGITYTGSFPPDTNLAVGDTQVVEVVNSQFAIFDKNGGVIRAATNLYTMFASMTGDDCSWRSGGDPIVQYDKMANRWLMARYLFATNFLCVAVSQTSDATGAYNLYSFSFGPDTADYPKFGVWPDGYYFSANTFAANGPFIGAQACAFDRYAMINGLANAVAICFQGTTAWRSLLPADLDSALPPPAGSPNYFLQYDTNSLSLFKFRPDFATPLNSTFTGPTTIPVAQFMPPCGACVPQPGTKDKLETLGSRLMYRLSYNNFGSHESLLATHTVQLQFNGNNPQTGIRWYELRNPGAVPVVHQQSTFSPDTSLYRWLPSIAQDKNGNIFLGYSASSATTFPGVRLTVRRSTDPLNQMQPESLIKAGLGSQTIPASYNRDRWGDYASVAVDPVDGCTLWFATEYLTTTGPSNTWATHLFSAKFSGCN